MADRDYTPHQQKIIKRYYNQLDSIQLQRLSDLATELYLAEGKKRERLWTQAGDLLTKLGLPEARIQHILAKRDPALLPGVVQELDRGGK